MNLKSPGPKAVKKPRVNRTGRNDPDELYHKVLLWLYGRQDRRRARPFAERLAEALDQNPAYQSSAFADECWSLIFEARADLSKAIKYRQQEIQKIRKLHQLTLDTPQREDILKIYGFDDLGDRLDLLALLYQEQGNLAKARAVLNESRALAHSHGYPFDGADMLDEVEEEMRAKRASKNGAAVRNGARRVHS